MKKADGSLRSSSEARVLTTFRVLKDRYTGDAAGLKFGLRYDTDTGILLHAPLPTSNGDEGGNPFAADIGEY
jgi:hypothetical protein